MLESLAADRQSSLLFHLGIWSLAWEISGFLPRVVSLMYYFRLSVEYIISAKELYYRVKIFVILIGYLYLFRLALILYLDSSAEA